MGFFTKKKVEPCKEGAVCAWEFNGALFKSKAARDDAESMYKLNKTIDRLAQYLQEPGIQYRRPPAFAESPVFTVEYGVCVPFFTASSMRADQVARKLVAKWPEIRDMIDNIVREGK